MGALTDLLNRLTADRAPTAQRSDMDAAGVRKLVERIAAEEGVPPQLAVSLASVESGLNPSAVGPETRHGQARGLFQIMPAFRADYGVADVDDPEDNARGALRTLRRNFERFGSWEAAVAAHHAGARAVERAGGAIPGTADVNMSTSDYVRRVMQQLSPDVAEQINVRPPASPRQQALDDVEALRQAFRSVPGKHDAYGFRPLAALKRGVSQIEGTWHVLARELERFITGSDEATAPALEQWRKRHEDLPADPRMAAWAQTIDEAPNLARAIVEGALFALKNPTMVANWMTEMAPSMVAGGAVGARVGPAVGGMASAAGATKGAASVAAASSFGATMNSAQVVLQGLGENYAEARQKGMPDVDAVEYATTKTIAEVGPNAVAGALMAWMPFASSFERAAKKAGMKPEDVRVPVMARLKDAALQSQIQGAGGAAGAYAAATAVGEEPRRSEMVLEWLGESLTAPAEMAGALWQNRRTAKDATDPKEAINLPVTPVVTIEDLQKQAAPEAPAVKKNPAQDEVIDTIIDRMRRSVEESLRAAAIRADETERRKSAAGVAAVSPVGPTADVGQTLSAVAPEMSDEQVMERLRAVGGFDMPKEDAPDAEAPSGDDIRRLRQQVDSLRAQGDDLKRRLTLADEVAALRQRAQEAQQKAAQQMEAQPAAPPARMSRMEELREQIREMRARIDERANEAATSPLNNLPQPTEAQKQAGNYKLGHDRIAGLQLSIENPAGSKRSGVDKDGKPWSVEMAHHYGYIRGTKGRDKDHIDAFVKPGTPPDWGGTVYVINQIDPKTGKFDEHKVMLGFDSVQEAEAAYRANYEPGWRGMGGITPMSMEEFKGWVYDEAQTRQPAGAPAAAPAPKAEAEDAAKVRGDQGKPAGESAAARDQAVDATDQDQGGQDLQRDAQARGEAGERAPQQEVAEFNVGDRVVIVGERVGSGRHGKVVDAQTFMIAPVFGSSRAARKSVIYTIQTDGGATFTASADEVAAEQGPAPEVVPDPVFDGKAIDIELLRQIIKALKQKIAHQKGKQSRARTIASQHHIGQIVRALQSKLDEAQRVLAEWESKAGQRSERPEQGEQRADRPQERPADKEPRQERQPDDDRPGLGVRLRQTRHGKTGEPLWVAQIDERLSRQEYERVAELARQNGGRWSKWSRGFEFKSESGAQRFAQAVGKPPSAQPAAEQAPAPSPAAEPVQEPAQTAEQAPAPAPAAESATESAEPPRSAVTPEYLAAGEEWWKSLTNEGRRRMLEAVGFSLPPAVLWKYVPDGVKAALLEARNEVDLSDAAVDAGKATADDTATAPKGDRDELAEPARVPARDGREDRGDGAAGGADRGPVGRRLAETDEEAGRERDVDRGAEAAGRAGEGSAGAGARDDASGAARDFAGVRDRPTAAGVAESPADHSITDADRIGEGGLKTKYRDNVAAIRLVKELERTGARATYEQQRVLARYVGWGGLKSVFDDKNKQWAQEYAELKSLLTPDEYAAARRSVLDAHYTSPVVIRGMYEMLRRVGFTGGRVLEPSAGVGHFIGLMPTDMRRQSLFTAVELDKITGLIAKHLYPTQNVIAPTGFQQVNILPDTYDVAIGNPPFGDQKLVDEQHPEWSKLSIHNFFFAKSMYAVRPGGLVQMVVSHFLMDAVDATARRMLAKQARLIAAVRLPKTAFKGNANTEVVTDILLFQKYEKNETPDENPDWLHVDMRTIDGKQVPVNRYYSANPANILGREAMTGSMYSSEEYTVEPGEESIADGIARIAKTLPQDIYTNTGESVLERITAVDGMVPPGVKVGGLFVLPSGEVAQRTEDVENKRQFVRIEGLTASAVERIKGMIAVRDALRDLIRGELKDRPDSELAALRGKLNEVYDAFVKRFGYINRLSNRRAFADDIDLPLLESLEPGYDPGISPTVAKKNGVKPRPPSAQKAPIFSRRVLVPYKEPTSVSTAKDALMASLNVRGGVDMPYMVSLYGKTEEEIVKELRGMIFRDPSLGWQTADVYLSGNVKAKLALAIQAAKTDPSYQENVAALEAIQPKDIEPHDIGVRIGSPWVPGDVILAFAKHLLGKNLTGRITYIKETARWNVAVENADPVASRVTWGTENLSAVEILSLLLNNRQVVVRRNIGTSEEPEYVVDEPATELARSKARAMSDAFRDWVWEDAERAQRLARIYNDTFNTNVPYQPDGSHLTLPGSSPLIKLRKHQANATWRGLQQKTLLLDQVVGSGKTFTMAAIAMEGRRVGIMRKPLFVVPNSLVRQWRDDFYRLYPNANILAATEKDFAKKNRQRLFSKIATGDWDAVIIAHSAMKKVEMPRDGAVRVLEEMVEDLTRAIAQAKAESGRRSVVRDMERARERFYSKMQRLKQMSGKKDKVVDFAELGIDAMFVDEAHAFKNLFYFSQMQNVAGLGSPSGSGRAFDMFVKARWLQNRGGSVVFATGTPVSNSLVEMFTMQRFLMYDELKRRGIHLLDAWTGVFGAVEQVEEVHPSGTGYRYAMRLARFVNLPELMSLYRSIADVITMTNLREQAAAEGKRFPVPKIKGGKPRIVVAQRSDLQRSFFGEPEFARDVDGEIAFYYEPGDLKVGQLDNGKFAVLDSKTGERAVNVEFETEADAERAMQEELAKPIVRWNQNSILWKFENLRKLMVDTGGKINALSITNEARKAALDYRIIDPNAPDFEGSKVNLAAAEIERIYRQWNADRGTQLVFCDLSIPSSARAKLKKQAEEAAAKEQSADLDQDETAETDDSADETEVQEDVEESGVSMDQLIALSAPFSVYDDLKAKLVQRGIPEKEIAFIHDYDTAAKKQELFAKVRAGEVRVLIGSTEKMGAGMNVQNRLVALHHLDAPWRPSDLEQREGRILRQGNELYERDPDGFEVEIIRYATDQTYDTRMWQIIEHKASAIEDLRRYNLLTREMEDVSGEAANAAEMKAAASGNPLILEEIRLRKTVRTLEAERAGFVNSRTTLQNRVAWLRGAEARAKTAIDMFTRLIEARTDARDSITIEGKAYKGATEKTPPWEEAVVGAFTRVAKMAVGEGAVIGVYRGIPFGLERVARGLELFVEDPKTKVRYNIGSGYGAKDVVSASGLVTRLNNALDGLEQRIKARQETMLSELEQLAAAEQELQKTWPRQTELDEARKKHNDVLSRLRTSGVSMAMTTRMRAELREALAKRGIRGIEVPKQADVGTPPQEDGRAGVMESRAARPNDTIFTRVANLLADVPGLFRYSRVSSSRLEEILGAMSKNAYVASSKSAGDMVDRDIARAITIRRRDSDGWATVLVYKDGTVTLDSSLWGGLRQEGDPGSREGGALYQAVATWAHNNGLVFRGDDFLTEIGALRRAEHMLASALYFGTTRHLHPGPRMLDGSASGKPESRYGLFRPIQWREGDDAFNIEQLANAVVNATMSVAPDWVKEARYDWERDEFVRADGSRISDADFADAARYARLAFNRQRYRSRVGPELREGASDQGPFGGGTIARAVALRSLGAAGGTVTRALLDRARVWRDQLVRGPEQGVPERLRGLIPSRGSGAPAAGMDVGTLRREAEAFVASMPGAAGVTVRVVRSADEVDAAGGPELSALAEAAIQTAADGKVTVWLVADALPTVERAKQVLLHEIVGHYGLSALLGDRFGEVLDAVKNQARAKSDRLREQARLAEQRYAETGKLEPPDFVVDPSDPDYATWEAVRLLYPDASEREVAGEVLARIAETEANPTLWERVVVMIRRALRAIGFALEYSNAELKQLVQDAARAMRRGRKLAATSDGAAESRGAKIASGAMADAWPDAARRAHDLVFDALSKGRSFGLWARTIGTQMAKARENPEFGAVFNRAQKFIDDIAKYALRAEAMAPTILPKVGGLKDVPNAVLQALGKGGMSTADNEWLGRVLAEGTLAGMEDENGDASPLKGKVWTSEELRTRFKATPEQIRLYREARAAIDQSLADTGRATMLSALRAAGFHQPAIDALENATTIGELLQRASDAVDRAAMLSSDEDAEQWAEDTKATLKGIADRVRELQLAGYAPLMRFGRFHLTGFAGGEVAYFGRFDSMAELLRERRRLQKENPEWEFSSGEMPTLGHELFEGVDPHTLMLFAEKAGFADEALQRWYQIAVADRSALKRMIHRQGTPGFSVDARRVLASFITSNARFSSNVVNAPAMRELADAVRDGGVKDEAIKLVQFVLKPTEEAAKVRALLFGWFLGGSIAAGVVNLTQPLLMTFPYLARFGVGNAARALKRGLADGAIFMRRGRVDDAELSRVLEQAKLEGLTEPSEIYALMAASRGSFHSPLMQAFHTVWGANFALSETFNRTVTFAAAFVAARDAGMKNPYDFAKRALYDTQGLYTRANRPNWARGAIGATLFTFKQFSIAYVEFLRQLVKDGTLPKTQLAVALALLIVASGLQGLPGADDLDDIIDAVGQWLGYSTNVRRSKRELFEAVLGETLGNIAMYGISTQLGLDLAARLGMGNLIPGTGALVPANPNKARDVAEWGGPLASLIAGAAAGMERLFRGDFAGAAVSSAPVAVRNVLKGVSMAATGEARDERGRTVAQSSLAEAITQTAGFTPQRIADESRRMRELRFDENIVNEKASEIRELWAYGVARGDQAAVSRAQEMLRNWNARNPDLRIRVRAADVLRRAKEMRWSREERFIRSAPASMRQRVRDALQRDDEE